MPDNKAATPPPLATPEEVAERRDEQQKEYGEYVAVAQISFNGALAYNVGDPVPVSNVNRYKYDEQGLVQKVGSKAAQEVISRLAASVEQVVVEQPAPVTLGVPLKS
jgi:hypothetical protein